MTSTTSDSPVYSAFWLYSAEPEYGRLPPAEQNTAKASFLHALESRPESVALRGAYSLVGLRHDADLMLWVYGPDLDDIQELAVALRRSGLGRYLRQAHAFLGVTTAPRYDPEHKPAFVAGAEPKAYASVYPFVKTAEWYLLSREERGRLMAEHGRVGRRYAVPRERLAPAGGTGGGAAAATAVETEVGGGVLSNTVDAYGLGDYEFILANESDDPSEITAMMMALRATEVRRYTRLDTPIFFGRLREPGQALDDL